MNKFYLIAILFIQLFITILKAQETKKCGFDLIYQSLANDSDRIIFESNFQEQNKKRSNQKSSAIITIPTVVHVIYRNSTQNISNQQINNQINVINLDFRKLNADTTNVVGGDSKADMRIEFRLATQDPNGNVTTGVTRTSTSIPNVCDFNKGSYDSIVPAWDRDSYMNIWVCEAGSGVAGYAYPPNFPGVSKDADGIVVDYTNFGTGGTAAAPYDLGRTLSHEIGHWLNLLHPWGTNNGSCTSDDGVNDTPKQSGAVGGAFNNCQNPTNTCSSRDMLSNFMQWVDDRCMGNFTLGQKNRARTGLEIGRASLLNSKGLEPVGLFENKLKPTLKIYPNPNSGTFRIEGDFDESTTNTIQLFDLSGKSIPFQTNRDERGLIISLRKKTAGFYVLRLENNNGILMQKLTVYPTAKP